VPQTPALVNSMLAAIGNTPAVKLGKLPAPGSAEIVVKLEYYNPTGSYKDRMALAMIEGAESRGVLRPGMRVVEFTGGSTGSSLAMVCAVKGYRFMPVSNDAIAPEKLQTMRALGADLQVLKTEDKKLSPELIQRMKAETDRLAREPNTYFTDQFNNTDALTGYSGIAKELFQQLGRKLSVFCGAVGTAGMIVGVSRTLKALGCPTRIVALEPASSAFLTAGKPGAHNIDGVAPGFVPPHLKPSDYDEALALEESEARETARRLAREEGILAGTSTGLNVAAALRIAKELGPGHTVATVAVDTGFKYLQGDLYSA
jgi:cysteine synthase